MKTKKNGLIFTILIGLLVLLTATSIGFYVSRPQSMAAANSGAESQSAYPGKPANIPTPQPSIKVLSQTVNEITVEVTSAKIVSTGIEIGICYTTLDGGEWYPTPGHLFYSTYEIYPDEIEFTTEKLADGNNLGKRCALVRYRIDDIQNITTPIQFSIMDMYAPQREMYSACQEFQQRLNTNPKAKAYGLKAKCTENSDGSISVVLVDRGKSATEGKAKDVLDSIANGVVLGPWEFTVTALEK